MEDQERFFLQTAVFSFFPIYFKVIVRRLKLSTFRRTKVSVIRTQETRNCTLEVDCHESYQT